MVYQFHTVKPLDTATLDVIASKVRKIVVVEEHVPAGGLSSAVGNWLVRQPKHPELVLLDRP